MKKTGIFIADFEGSKKIVTDGKTALTAGMSNPIQMGIINRLFTVLIAGFFFFGILMYALLFGMPSGIATTGEVHYISYESAVLISHIGEIMMPVNWVCYLTFLIGLIPIFWPKKRLNSQLWTYFPCYFPMSAGAFISLFYFASAVTYDAYTIVGFWLQLLLGIGLFLWININSLQNLKRRLNNEEEKSIRKPVMRIALGTMAVLFPVSLVYHLMNGLPVHWYFYIFGLFLVVLFIIYAYFIASMINVHIIQAYYIHKYPEEYKEYLDISDREWYSKRYYKKLVKSSRIDGKD